MGLIDTTQSLRFAWGAMHNLFVLVRSHKHGLARRVGPLRPYSHRLLQRRPWMWIFIPQIHTRLVITIARRIGPHPHCTTSAVCLGSHAQLVRPC